MNSWHNTLIYIFVIVLVFGCNSEDETSQSINLKPITLTKGLTISANNPDVLIGNFSGLAVDKEGRIAAADTRSQKIHLFSSNGQYLDSLGRRGKGPGEFIGLDPEIRILSDTLYAMDDRKRRINMFGLESRQPIGTINIPNAELDGVHMGGAREVYPLSDGDLLVVYVHSYFTPPEEQEPPHMTTVSVIDKAGNFVEKNLFQFPTLFPTDQKLLHLGDGSIAVFSNLTFFPATKMAIDPEEHLHIGKSDSLIIREYGENGTVANVISENYKPPRLSDGYMDSLFSNKGDAFEKAVNEVGRPDNWPVFADFFFDDSGRCWVELINPGKSQKTWWVFDRDGKARWQFQLPEEMTLFEVQDGKAYGISQPEGGISGIVRYEINGI